MPHILPPDIPGKDDTIPHDISIPDKDGFTLDDEDFGEEWKVDPETIPGKIVQNLNLQTPVTAVSNAASTVADTTTQAAQMVKENSNYTYILLNQGQWHGRSPANYIAIVCFATRSWREVYSNLFRRSGLCLAYLDPIVKPISSPSVGCRVPSVGELPFSVINVPII
jgi:hypothetical protein